MNFYSMDRQGLELLNMTNDQLKDVVGGARECRQPKQEMEKAANQPV